MRAAWRIIAAMALILAIAAATTVMAQEEQALQGSFVESFSDAASDLDSALASASEADVAAQQWSDSEEQTDIQQYGSADIESEFNAELDVAGDSESDAEQEFSTADASQGEVDTEAAADIEEHNQMALQATAAADADSVDASDKDVASFIEVDSGADRRRRRRRRRAAAPAPPAHRPHRHHWGRGRKGKGKPAGARHRNGRHLKARKRTCLRWGHGKGRWVTVSKKKAKKMRKALKKAKKGKKRFGRKRGKKGKKKNRFLRKLIKQAKGRKMGRKARRRARKAAKRAAKAAKQAQPAGKPRRMGRKARRRARRAARRAARAAAKGRAPPPPRRHHAPRGAPPPRHVHRHHHKPAHRPPPPPARRHAPPPRAVHRPAPRAVHRPAPRAAPARAAPARGGGGGGRRRFFLQVGEEVTPYATEEEETVFLEEATEIEADADGEAETEAEAETESETEVDAEAETDADADAADASLAETGSTKRRRRRVWVQGKWQCLSWSSSSPAPVDSAPAPPAPRPKPWCETNAWMKSSSNAPVRVAWMVRCTRGAPAAPPNAPKSPKKIVSWCQANVKMKSGTFAPFYYRKCGGSPPPLPKPLKPKSIPAPPKTPVEKKDWCRDFKYLALTGSRPYYCLKCPTNCSAAAPRAPPRPAGVAAAPAPRTPARKTWCQDNDWMKFGRHSDYFFTKCGGRPPKKAPQQPAGVTTPPKKSTERKPWCVEHNYMRFDKKTQPFFYAKCGSLVPAAPKKQPKCPAFMPAITDANRGDACTDMLWMKSRDNELKDCYCSRCSCPSGQANCPAPSKKIVPPPAKEASRGGWCKQYAYLRYGSDECFYCQTCGCSKPRHPLPAVAKVPTAPAAKKSWCEENGAMRYAGGAKAVFFYEKCGLRPKPEPKQPAGVEAPPPPQSRAKWCAQQKSLLKTNKDFYCSKCRCELPPPPSVAAKPDPDFCETNRFMVDTAEADLYYSKCGGKPKAKPVAPKAPQTVTIAPPTGNTNQVHVHVNVAAPKVKKSNAALEAMVQRVTKKNQQAADKMDQILRKLKSQDCRGGNCLPQTHKDMEKWKADWVLETEETGSIFLETGEQVASPAKPSKRRAAALQPNGDQVVKIGDSEVHIHVTQLSAPEPNAKALNYVERKLDRLHDTAMNQIENIIGDIEHHRKEKKPCLKKLEATIAKFKEAFVKETQNVEKITHKFSYADDAPTLV